MRYKNKKPQLYARVFLLLFLAAPVYTIIAIARETLIQLQRDNVASCWAFLAVFDGELNLLAFVQRFEIVALNSREMYEYIFAAIVRSNETKTFTSVKPFY